MTTSRVCRAQVGFTLLEVLIALAILSFMMIVAWSTIYTTATAKTRWEEVQERNHEIRVAMTRLVQDISSAYLSTSENQNLPNRRTMFIGKSSGSVDELRFSSLGHRSMWANANESEQTRISYYPASDRDNRDQTNLLRREARRLSNDDWRSEPGQVDVLLRDVESVRFEYFDAENNEWRRDWDSTSAERRRIPLPMRVRITVEVKAPGRPAHSDRTIKYTSQARIMMQEELRVVI